MSALPKLLGGATISDLDDRTIVAVISDSSIDRVGDILEPSGCDLSNYKQNNIVLANHDPGQPVGTAQVWVAAADVAKITFAAKGVSQLADEWCTLAKTGIVQALSVGFHPIESEPRPGGGRLYRRWELLECSLVSVPCNANAIVVQRGAGAYRKVCGSILVSQSFQGFRAYDSMAHFAFYNRREMERDAQKRINAFYAPSREAARRNRIAIALELGVLH